MPTPSSLAARLTNFAMTALEKGSAIAVSSHTVFDIGSNCSLVSWDCDSPPDLSSVSMEDIASYLFFLAHGHYSVVCPDGAIVQMSFKVKRGEIIHHRLCYLPCPVLFDEDELAQDSLLDIVERNLRSGDYDLMRYRGGVRFDYDPAAEKTHHPSSHLTINFDSVRVPVRRNMDARTFLDFLDSHFISSRGMIPFGSSMGFDVSKDVLAVERRTKPHISWEMI